MNGTATTSVGEKELRKPGSIGIQLDELIQHIDVLAKAVAQHEQRINPILTPVPPNNSDKSADEGSPTDLGRALVRSTYKVRAISEHLRSIDSRVEL